MQFEIEIPLYELEGIRIKERLLERAKTVGQVEEDSFENEVKVILEGNIEPAEPSINIAEQLVDFQVQVEGDDTWLWTKIKELEYYFYREYENFLDEKELEDLEKWEAKQHDLYDQYVDRLIEGG